MSMSSGPSNSCNADTPTDPKLVTKSSVNYKAKLDRAALKAHQQEQAEQDGHETLLEKVSHYVPVVGKLLHHEKEEGETEIQATAGPPDRPHNDSQIEEFLRDQHRSTTKSGQLEDGDHSTG